MSGPISICIEDLYALPEARYLSCVALEAGRTGLAIGPDGQARWQEEAQALCELRATFDERLELFRRSGSPEVILHRAGRALEVAEESPTVLLQDDELEIGGRRLRIHLHGPAEAAAPPQLQSTIPGPTLQPVEMDVRVHPPKPIGNVRKTISLAIILVVIGAVAFGIALLLTWLL